LNFDLNINQVKDSTDKLERENKDNSEMNNLLTKKMNEFEVYNRALLEKIKELNKEKDEILISENKKKLEIEKKCEDFKKEVVNKFEKQLPEINKLKEDNEFLRNKVVEYKTSTEEIRNSIESQINSNEEDLLKFEDEFRKNMKENLKNLEENTNKFLLENSELKSQLINYYKKYEELSNRVSKFTSSFDSGKKELENVKYFYLFNY
jgi:chromosome segregation ATPase